MRAPAPLVLAACLTAGGCSGAVSVPPAPDAADPACAQVVAAAPEEVLDASRRETTAQSALAWGEPPVVLRCGVTPLPPTDEPCLGVETEGVEVDWVRVDGDEGTATFTTYGRVPSLEVVVPAELTADPAQPLAVLGALAPAAEVVPATRECR